MARHTATLPWFSARQQATGRVGAHRDTLAPELLEIGKLDGPAALERLGTSPQGLEEDSCADIVRLLSQPRHFSEQPARVELIETHFAWVFMTELHAYKLKKPMRTAWMDYRTIAARRRGCRDELVLNRRLAPKVYLDVVPIVRNPDHTLSLGYTEASRVVDWVVKMRRLPASRMLDRAIADGSVRKAGLLSYLADGAAHHPCTQNVPGERHDQPPPRLSSATGH